MAIALALELVGDDRARHSALLVVAPADAENVPQAALGDARIGGRRRDLQDAVVLQNLGGGHGDAGIEVADDEFHAVGREFVGDRHAFLRIAAVVADAELDLLAEDAARRVDVIDRLLDALLELGAEGRAAAGQGPRDAELDLGMRASRHRKSKAKRQGEGRAVDHVDRPPKWLARVGRAPIARLIRNCAGKSRRGKRGPVPRVRVAAAAPAG